MLRPAWEVAVSREHELLTGKSDTQLTFDGSGVLKLQKSSHIEPCNTGNKIQVLQVISEFLWTCTMLLEAIPRFDHKKCLLHTCGDIPFFFLDGAICLSAGHLTWGLLADQRGIEPPPAVCPRHKSAAIPTGPRGHLHAGTFQQGASYSELKWTRENWETCFCAFLDVLDQSNSLWKAPSSCGIPTMSSRTCLMP